MGLVIVIEPHGTYAIYEQIVNQIKNQIISGELQPDEALPSIRGLAADIGVSVITTKHAYEELDRKSSETGQKPRDYRNLLTQCQHTPDII